MKVSNVVALSLLLPLSIMGRRLGEEQEQTETHHSPPHRPTGDKKDSQLGQDGHRPKQKFHGETQSETVVETTKQRPKQEKKDTSFHGHLNESTQQKNYSHGASHQKNQRDEPTTQDCGSFVIRQQDGLVIYDNFENFDPNQDSVDGKHGLMCSEIESKQGPGKAFCMGGDEHAAVLVQGTCRRGAGYTTVSFVNDNKHAASELEFACEKSARATPSIKCKCSFADNSPCNGQEDIPFRAEARFGFITMPAWSSAHCTLVCKMPTTDE